MKGTIRVVGAALLLIALAGCQGPYLMEIMQEQGEARTAKAITAFSFVSPAATGTINENTKTIAVAVPYGTNVTALVATFSTTGSSVMIGSTVQVSGTTANDFSSPVFYTVKAADGSTASYTVMATVAPSSAKAITAFSFPRVGAMGTIDEAAKTIAVTVPFGTDVTGLVATFTTTGTSVTVGSTVQVSGTTANNFTGPVTYTVTAADNSTASYTVTVTTNLSSKAITAFSFAIPAATGVINENAKTVAVTVPSGTNLGALVATFATTGSSVMIGFIVQVSGTTANNFTNPVIYTVKAPDGTTASYMVTVTTVPRTGLVAEYLFSGNAADTSGNGHHGIVHGATLTSDRFGNTNSAYSFDGVDDYIEVPLSVDPNIDSFSFHSFVLLDVVGKHFEGFHLGNNGGEIRLSCSDLGIGFGFGAMLSDGSNRRWYDGLGKAVESGRWYSIAGVYIRGSKVRLFVDGVLVDEQDVPNLSLFIYPPLRSTLGCVDFSSGCQFCWQGKMDDFRFYIGALTDTEIGELFHEGGWTGN